MNRWNCSRLKTSDQWRFFALLVSLFPGNSSLIISSNWSTWPKIFTEIFSRTFWRAMGRVAEERFLRISLLDLLREDFGKEFRPSIRRRRRRRRRKNRFWSVIGLLNWSRKRLRSMKEEKCSGISPMVDSLVDWTWHSMKWRNGGEALPKNLFSRKISLSRHSLSMTKWKEKKISLTKNFSWISFHSGRSTTMFSIWTFERDQFFCWLSTFLSLLDKSSIDPCSRWLTKREDEQWQRQMDEEKINARTKSKTRTKIAENRSVFFTFWKTRRWNLSFARVSLIDFVFSLDEFRQASSSSSSSMEWKLAMRGEGRRENVSLCFSGGVGMRLRKRDPRGRLQASVNHCNVTGNGRFQDLFDRKWLCLYHIPL